ncbi:MAG: CAP domain-containing protein [Actinomycetota bacterium]|nr:CAP domain-containing protein [Actinomycetota bacterium]
MRRAHRRIAAILIAAGLLGGMGIFGAISAASATTSDESGFYSRINSERSSRGIHTVTLDAHLSDVARHHSQDMADRNELYHNDNLGNEVSGWEELDENVGEGGSVEDIHTAFMDSQVHRDAILGNYEKVGVGTVWKNGRLWVTEVFYRAYHSSASTAPHTASRPRTTSHPATTTRTRTVRRAPRRAAAQTPAQKRPVAPVAPIAAALPEVTSAKLEKLLGDLMITPADPADPSLPDAATSEGGNVVALRPAAEPTDTRLGTALWEIIDTQAS